MEVDLRAKTHKTLPQKKPYTTTWLRRTTKMNEEDDE
jgi:hypothetical protein